VEIELLRNNDCHIWQKALEELNETLKEEGLNADTKMTIIETKEQAEKRRFSGSPQININGKDVDPASENFTAHHVLGCRQYFYNGKHFEFPPKEMIKEALNKEK